MAVILPSTYRDGVVSVAARGKIVTGQNTFWGNPDGTGNPILPGDFFGVHQGYSIRIASIESNTSLTLADEWPGDAQTLAPYAIMLQSDNARMAETSRQLLVQLMSGNIVAFSSLVGAPDTIPYFTSPGAMGLLTKAELVNGVNYNVMVDTLADRAAYDGSATGFTVFVSDVGDGRAAVYSKRSNAAGDWSAAAYVTGPAGINPRGPWSSSANYVADDLVSLNGASYVALVSNTNVSPVVGGSATWGVIASRGTVGPGYTPRGTYAAGTAYAQYDTVLYNGSQFVATAATTGNAPPTLPATTNAWWTLLAQKGVDGTGTGDFVGPASSVTGNLVSFSNTTGKAGVDSGVSAGRVVQSPAGAVADGGAAVFDGVTGRLLKALTPAQFRTWLEMSAANVSFNNSVASLAGNPATVQAAIDALATASQGSGKNDALFAIEIADIKGQRLGMVGGVADSFDDTTGIATAGIGGIDGLAILSMHFDGANGSTVFTDSSFASKAFVASGSATISTTQSKFGGSSLLLDGSTGRLSRAYDADFDFSGDFTVDFWFRTTVDSRIVYIKGGGDGGIIISVGTTTLATGVTANRIGAWLSGSVVLSGTSVVTDGNWHHCAVTRSGSTARVFVDGNLEGAATHSAPLTANIATNIGSDGTGNFFNGNIDELRVSKGIARWTAAFTPPVGAYAVVGGIDANTISALHLDGSNGSTSIIDSASTPKTWSATGDAKISTTQSKFGGASAIFDGTGDRITSAVSTDYAFGTGDFTIESWVRFATVANAILFDMRSASQANQPLVNLVNGTNVFGYFSGASQRISGTTVPTANVWYHVAVVRQSGTVKLYVNGIQEGSSYADSTSVLSPAEGFYVGPYSGSTANLNGFMDEIRISNVARYAANFKPYNVAFFVDASGSVNYVYDAANDWFSPIPAAIVYGPDLTTSAQAISGGDDPSGGGVTFARAKAFDNDTTASTGWASSQTGSAISGVAYIGQDFGAGVAVEIRRVNIWQALATANSISSVIVQYSDNGSSWTAAGTFSIIYSTAGFQNCDLASYGSHRYWRILANANATGGWGVTEVEMMAGASGSYSNMTLLSVNYAAMSVPNMGRISLQVSDTVALVPGTDFTLEISRDGGATWTLIPVTRTMQFSGISMYEGQASLAAQPSGSSMVWRAKTLTNKNVIMSGVVLQQS